MAHGGRRPGAGRPKGSKDPHTLQKEAAREALRKLVLADLGPLVRAQIAKAKGIRFLVTRDKATGKFVPVSAKMLKALNPNDVLEVWEKTPDTGAFTDLMNRAIDKPAEQPQAVEFDGEVVIRWADEGEEA